MAAVGIIYRALDPREQFLEIKDDGHPMKLVRRKLCPIGGNWIGEEAKDDVNPLATFQREARYELSFDRPIRDPIELVLLGYPNVGELGSVSPLVEVPSTADIEDLERVKRAICELATPLVDFFTIIGKEAMDAADPENKRETFAGLATYCDVPLPEDVWEILVRLQKKFGNLSNESITVITSLEEIIRTGTQFAFAHDRVFREFFLSRGFREAQNISLVTGVDAVCTLLPPWRTYEDYLMRYHIAKKPI